MPCVNVFAASVPIGGWSCVDVHVSRLKTPYGPRGQRGEFMATGDGQAPAYSAGVSPALGKRGMAVPQ